MSLYRILFSTIPWLDKNMKEMPKLTFMQGDKIDSPMENVTDYVTFVYTKSEGNDRVVSRKFNTKGFCRSNQRDWRSLLNARDSIG